MKLFLLTLLTIAGLMFFLPEADTASQSQKSPAAADRANVGGARQASPLDTRLILIDRKNGLREERQKSMPLHEEIVHSRGVETHKEFYEKNLISKSRLESSERALVLNRLDVEPLRERMAEEERTLFLAEEAGDEELHEDWNTAPIRYDGAPSWSLVAFKKISSFFHQRFGRPLPISALGQSDTHDRLGLDHRGSVDVALRPDSAEGRDLMAFLRKNDVPFMAFRGKLSSMSTGAHIHIGRPSPRLARVNQQVTSAKRGNDGAEPG